jgi:hypothetical protein
MLKKSYPNKAVTFEKLLFLNKSHKIGPLHGGVLIILIMAMPVFVI